MIKTYVSLDLFKLQISCCFHEKNMKAFSNELLFYSSSLNFYCEKLSVICKQSKTKVSMFLTKPLCFTSYLEETGVLLLVLLPEI